MASSIVPRQQYSWLPLSKLEPPNNEAREFQKILLKACILHTFGALLSMVVDNVNIFMVIKHGVLLYIAFYSRATLNIMVAVVYMILLLIANTLSIFNLSEFGNEDPGAITVNILFFGVSMVLAYFVGEKIINFYHKTASPKLIPSHSAAVDEKV